MHSWQDGWADEPETSGDPASVYKAESGQGTQYQRPPHVSCHMHLYTCEHAYTHIFHNPFKVGCEGLVCGVAGPGVEGTYCSVEDQVLFPALPW